jgi:hypothetical protein
MESNDGEIDVDAVMNRVQRDVLRSRYVDPPGVGHTVETIDMSSVEALIAMAAARSGPRVRWPARLGFVPTPLRRLTLRVIGWLFRDQFAFNSALIQALRESVAFNERLQVTLRELDARVRSLKGRD